MVNNDWMDKETTPALWIEHNLSTIDQIVEHIIAEYTPDELIDLREYCEKDYITNFSRFIRNRYMLWWSHPLTQKWRENIETRDIREGIDYSIDHPDSISAEIITIILHKLRC